jgi:nucleoporin NUP1
MSPTEKLINTLDLYKTPIIPSRLRNETSRIPASSSSSDSLDLFRKRKRMVLMTDEDGRKVKGPKKGPTAHKTKPYAGEGGMKRLLAKRKTEAEEAAKEKEQRSKDTEKASKEIQTIPFVETTPPPASALRQEEWFKPTAEGQKPPLPSTSTLRVGRTMTHRNHGPPVSRPNKPSFSVPADEEEMADETNNQPEVKTVPMFAPPEGFSFASNASYPLSCSMILPLIYFPN